MRSLRSVRAILFVFFSGQAFAQIVIDCLSVTCPADMVMEATSPNGAQVYFAATGTNRCSTKYGISYRPRPGSTFALGTNTVTATIADGIRHESCSFKIIVRDTTAPRILAPRSLKVGCESSKGTRVEFSVTATDACDTNVTVTCTPASGSLFPKGTNMVTCVAVDEFKNRRVVSFPVIVEGDCSAQAECLVLNVPADVTLTTTNKTGRRVFYNATAEGDCSRIEPSISFEPPSGSVFAPGESLVMVTATQGIFVRKGTFKVTLRDEGAPVLNVPEDMVVDAAGSDGAVVNFSVSATDDCSTNIAVSAEPESGSLFPIGKTAVICEAVDEAGNRSIKGFSVTVRRPEPRIGPSATFRDRYEVNWAFAGKIEVSPTIAPAQWRAWSGSILSNGLNRRILFSPTDAAFFVRIAPGPSGFKADADGDGVTDGEDKCPKTLPGKLVDDCGCSPVQLAKTPEAALEAVHAGIADALRLLEQNEKFEEVRGKLAEEAGPLETSARLMKSGSITTAATTLSNSFLRLKGARDEMARSVSNFSRTLPRTPEYGDADEDDFGRDEMEIALRKVTRAVESAATARKSFDFTSRSVTKVGPLSGSISKLGTGGTDFTADDGLHVEFSSNYQEFLSVDKGAYSGSGVTFNDGTAMMTESDRPVATTGPDTTPAFVYLQFAPFQKFLPAGPWIAHNPRGYFRTNSYGNYVMEYGMRFAAGGFKNPPANVHAFGLRLDFGYESTNGNYKEITLATLLKVGDTPVPLPGDVKHNGTLTVTKIRVPKTSGGGAGTPETIGTEVLSIIVQKRYSIATARYATTIFALEDSPETTGYGINSVIGYDVIYPLSYFTNQQFVAEAYWPNGNVSTYPQAFPITMYVPFAVNAQDFYAPEFGALSELAQGTDKPSGLRWPRIVGLNNGYPYSYSVGVPPIVRDLISFCSDTLSCDNDAETYYRLPFIGGWPTWTQSQANCGSFTHKGNSRYAFDMAAPLNTEVRAARGGVVTFVREDEHRNCCPGGDCPDDCDYAANVVQITHQDGTRGRYLHMPENGVVVAEGMRVRRGEVIAKVGNTGYSTGPHLHFEVREPESGTPTIPVRFQMWSAARYDTIYIQDTPLRNCVLPLKGDPLFSNNWAWDE